MAFLVRRPAAALEPSGWTQVTPGGLSLDPDIPVNNFGLRSAVADPANPGHVYATASFQGLWRSTSYGQLGTWTRVTITGDDPCANGHAYIAFACDGSYLVAITLFPINGINNGVWKSLNHGSTWTYHPNGVNDDLIAVWTSPTEPNRVITSCHSAPFKLFESVDAAANWTDQGLVDASFVSYPFFTFVNAGVLLAMDGGDEGPGSGTWRGVRSGASWPWTWTWTSVDIQQHWHAFGAMCLVTSTGDIFSGGAFGIRKSTNAGLSFSQVEASDSGVIVQTPTRMYSTKNYAAVGGFPPNLLHSTDLAGTSWIADATPAFNNGWATAVVVTNGVQQFILSANWNAGLWRYVE